MQAQGSVHAHSSGQMKAEYAVGMGRANPCSAHEHTNGKYVLNGTTTAVEGKQCHLTVGLALQMCRVCLKTTCIQMCIVTLHVASCPGLSSDLPCREAHVVRMQQYNHAHCSVCGSEE